MFSFFLRFLPQSHRLQEAVVEIIEVGKGFIRIAFPDGKKAKWMRDSEFSKVGNKVRIKHRRSIFSRKRGYMSALFWFE